MLLAVCAPGWEQLPAEERACVLVPAYMALCHLVLHRETRRACHAEAAETLALIALARVSDAGLGGSEHGSRRVLVVLGWVVQLLSYYPVTHSTDHTPGRFTAS